VSISNTPPPHNLDAEQAVLGSADDNAVPLELGKRPQWVAWRVEVRKDKPTKVPVNPRTGANADTTDPDTWGTLDEALHCREEHQLDGVGFVVTDGDPYCGIDLDSCRDPVTGKIAPWAHDIIVALNSYSEITPSGRGVHVWGKGNLPPGRRKRGHIEMYDRSRFFTVTGQHLKGTPTTIEECGAEVAALHASVFGMNMNGDRSPLRTSNAGISASDTAIIERALQAKNGEKFRKLWHGDWNDYPSQSEADLALCGMLAFHAGDDIDRVDRLFRLSGLFRPKWDERHAADGSTYARITIARAITGRATSSPARQAPTPATSGRSGMQGDAEAAPLPASLAREAFHGLAGALTDTIAPHSEADPAAILTQMLVIFGNIVGRNPHFMVEDDRHGTNEFLVTVGSTGHGRKGVAFGRARRPFITVDPDWINGCVQGGLSSGEGLIAAVRDPVERQEPVKGRGHVTSCTTVIADPGVTDKRLLVVETEFAKLLRVMERDGNTLSETMRQGWDSTGILRVMTRTNPLKATGVHISLIGHVTRDELLRYLTSTEAANGFANRFVWLSTRRAQMLPEGGNLTDADLAPFVQRLQQAVDFGRSVGRMTRDAAARGIWRDVYPTLSAGAPGLLGAVTSRAEAHVLRFSLIYALLDLSDVVRAEHLMAALALWDHAAASARYLFGTSLGDPTADEILRALRKAPDGLTVTAIYDHFKRHRRKEEIDRALGVLLDQGLARPEHVETAGRPSTRWRAAPVA